MTFRQMRLSLKLMVEERIGAPRYHHAIEQRQREDAAFDALRQRKGATP